MYKIFVINGIYDILCALTILDVVKIPILQDLHLSMFREELNNISKRMFAYWIMTYGFMRLSNNPYIIYQSYLLEALFFLNETRYTNIIVEKSFFVIISSFLLGNIIFFMKKNPK